MGNSLRKRVDTWLADEHPGLFDSNPEFIERVDLHFNDFFTSYRRLYGHLPDIEHRILHLLALLIDGIRSRPAALRQVDLERHRNPLWFQDSSMVGMMMYVDLFAGDMQGLYRRIDYLREIGITYLHLMPFLRSRHGQNDGGYAVSDFRAVDTALGSIKDLRRLVTQLHRDGISVAIDFVMNHTAREHEWAQRALHGETTFQDYYLIFDDRSTPDAFEKTLPEVFPDFAPGSFTYLPELEKWVWTTFHDFQWDLNYKNPDVFQAMLGEMIFLANIGVDVLRLDAVPFTWKRLGTNCQNQVEAIILLVAYRALMRMVAPAVVFKAEAIVDPDEIVRYLGAGGYEGKACDIAYNATLMNHLWHALACQNTHLLRTTLTNLPPTHSASTWINYIRCHDDIGWGISDDNATAVGQNGRLTRRFCTDFYAGVLPESYAEGYRFQVDKSTCEARISGTAAALTGLQKAIIEGDADATELALARLHVLNGVMFFMKGIPLIYSGDEIGQLNHYAYLDDPYKRGDNRWVHRPPMDWVRAELRHDPASVEGRLFRSIQQLVAARKGAKSLSGQADQRIVLVDSDSLFVVERELRDEAILLVANLSDQPQVVDLGQLPAAWQNGRFHDLIMSEHITYTFGDLAIGPYECLWLTHPHNNMPSRPVAVSISIEVETKFGEMVYLTGNVPELGEWRNDYAIGPLSPDRYPIWTGGLMIPEGNVFKYTWLKKRGNEVVEVGADAHFMRARAR